jgi:hypothetical protein
MRAHGGGPQAVGCQERLGPRAGVLPDATEVHLEGGFKGFSDAGVEGRPRVVGT